MRLEGDRDERKRGARFFQRNEHCRKKTYARRNTSRQVRQEPSKRKLAGRRKIHQWPRQQ